MSKCCDTNRNNGKKKSSQSDLGKVTFKVIVTSPSVSKDVHICNTYRADLVTRHAGIWLGLDGQSALKKKKNKKITVSFLCVWALTWVTQQCEHSLFVSLPSSPSHGVIH